MNNKLSPPAIGIAIVTHAPLAAALLAVAAHVLGEAGVLASGAVFIDIAADSDPAANAAQIQTALAGCATALILTDLPHATPHNCAVAAAQSLPNTQVLSHVTAGMVLRAVMNCQAAQALDLAGLVEKLRS